MDTIYFVSCVSRKRSSPARARDLYISEWFRRARSYVEATGCPWYILSAEYDLVHPDTVIAPYERTLNRMTVAERRAWAERVRYQLYAVPVEGSRIVVLAGKRYRELLLDELYRRGASVEVPMEGLRFGEQLQWLSRHVEGETAKLPGGGQHGGEAEGDVPGEAGDHAVTARLFELEPQIEPEALFPALEPGASRFARDDPYAFLLAVCLDRGTKADIIWTIPYWLKQQWGHLDPARVRRMSGAELYDAVNRLPRRPRYLSAAPKSIADLTRIVVDEYGGDARALWRGRAPSTFQALLQRIRGVGPGIASMAVQLLERAFPGELQASGYEELDIKPDVHTIRVLYRLGVAASESEAGALAAARRLHPEHPGRLDGPLWYVGYTWCHARNPDCGACFVANVCVRRGVEDRPDKVSAGIGQGSPATRPEGPSRRDKYAPLREYLEYKAAHSRRVTLSFHEIEDILGQPLPRSAYDYQAWWANTRGGPHVHARAWMESGYRVDSVNLGRRRVEFVQG